MDAVDTEYYVVERLSGGFPPGRPGLPPEVLGVFNTLSSRRGAGSAKIHFVLGNHAAAIIDTAQEPRGAASRGQALRRRTLDLYRIYAEDCVLPWPVNSRKLAARVRDLMAWDHDLDRFHDLVRELTHRAAADRVGEGSSRVLHMSGTLRGLATLASPQAVETRANALYGVYAALSTLMPDDTQVRVLLTWCGAT